MKKTLMASAVGAVPGRVAGKMISTTERSPSLRMVSLPCSCRANCVSMRRGMAAGPESGSGLNSGTAGPEMRRRIVSSGGPGNWV